MRTGPITTLAALALGVVCAPELAAQDGASGSIDGFNGVQWGASAADISAAHGEPAQVDTLDNGIVVIVYREELLGEPSVALYALLPDEGLVKGQHLAKLRLDEGDCEAQYRTYRDHVTLSFPLIAPVENYDYPFTEDFCTALKNERGEWANQWVDPSNGAVVTVIVERGSDEVKLIYESAAFLDWIRPEPTAEGVGPEG